MRAVRTAAESWAASGAASAVKASSHTVQRRRTIICDGSHNSLRCSTRIQGWWHGGGSSGPGCGTPCTRRSRSSTTRCGSRCTAPRRAVTVLTGGREPRPRVAGVDRGVEVLLVTRHTRRNRDGGEPRGAVTLLAGEHPMPAGQRESGGVVVEARRGPDRRRVALIAGQSEAGRYVVRGLGGQIERPVAVDALGRDVDERQAALGSRRVAGFTLDHQVRPAERKARQLVGTDHAGAVEEVAGRVTAGAIVAQLAPVDVLVARGARAGGPPKVERHVARPAGGLGVRAGEGEPLLRVVELRADARRSPGLGTVTHGALLLQLAVWIPDRLLPRCGRPRERRERRCQTERSGSHEPLRTLSPWHASHLPEMGR